MRFLPLFIASALLVLPADAPAGRRNVRIDLPVDRVDSYRFDTTHTVEAAVSKQNDLQLPAFRTRATGRLEQRVPRVFRDGTHGLLARVVDVQWWVDRGAGEHPLEGERLEGRSLALRVDDGGALLDVVGVPELAGAAGGFDAIRDVLVSGRVPLPMDWPTERPQGRLVRERVTVDAFADRDTEWSLRYLAAPAPDDCRACRAVRYEATVVEVSVDRHPSRGGRLDGKGTVEGLLVFEPRSTRLRSHRWSQQWWRGYDAGVGDEDGGGPGAATGTAYARVEQVERIEGSIVREAR